MSKIYDALKKSQAEQAKSNSAASELFSAAARREKEIAAPVVQPHEPVRLTYSKKRRGPRLLDRASTRASDEFQVLASTIRGATLDRGKHVLVVTSAIAGEGKSFVSLNLADALARLGCEVILVDADLRTPSLHLPLGTPLAEGLIGYMTKRAELPQCIIQTHRPNLSLVPSGGATRSAPELFARDGIRDFIAAAHRFAPSALILIDSTPVLGASETRLLGNVADAVIFVVGANQTPRRTVSRALSLINDAPLLGVVLNRFEAPYSSRREYGYGYSAKTA